VTVGFAALPLATALLAAALAARVAGSAVRRYQPAKIFWAVGLLLFGLAAAAEAYGAAGGWGSVAFKVYYLAGGCLTVAFLGVGAGWLALRRDWSLVLTGALVASTLGAAVTVLVGGTDPALLASASGHEPPPNAAITGHAYLWAIGLNTVGSLLLIGVAIVSIVRRRRPRANILLLAGVALVALSGLLTRVGTYGFVYIGQMIGLVLLVAGFELATRASAARRPRGLGVLAPPA
jgi:hypothetical protein